MHRMEMLYEFSELNWLFEESSDINSFLHKIVVMVARHMKAGCCTIFLWNEETEELVLQATVGINREMEGRISLKEGEGLTGIALKELRPICVKNASEHPDFKPFPGVNDNRFDSFLAVPILRGISKIGVLVLERDRTDVFTKEDIQSLTVIASQLANIIENAKFFLLLPTGKNKKVQQKELKYNKQRQLKGISASDGCAFGETVLINREKSYAQLLDMKQNDSITHEDLKNSIKKTESQLKKLQSQIEEKLDDTASLIFTSHLLMLKDQSMADELTDMIQSGQTPITAFFNLTNKYIGIFAASANPFVHEKVNDIEDLAIRVIGNLVPSNKELIYLEDKIVIAHKLFPSDILKLSSEKVGGIILVSGGVTSHVSILARSLQIPLVIVDMPELLNLAQDTKIFLNAETGSIFINPNKDVLEYFDSNGKTQPAAIRAAAKPKTFSKDGVRIKLLANINLLSDINTAIEANAEGIGLYRTEFPFLIRNSFPSEDEQYRIYEKLVDKAKKKEITFRTLDIGGDKVLSYYKNYQEANPFLGLRSIRFSLKNVFLFKEQIRAILKASLKADVKIMFPMISSLDEFLAAKDIVNNCKEELLNEEIPFSNNIEIGLMVEVPSLVEIMDDLAKEADFFSIGTNDFIQYLLGVDRANEKVADLYLPHHPSVLRSLKRIVSTANSYNRDISICGEMAHQEQYVPFLLGIGIRKFSMASIYIPKMQNLISGINITDAEVFADELLQKGSVSEIIKSLEVFQSETQNRL